MRAHARAHTRTPMADDGGPFQEAGIGVEAGHDAGVHAQSVTQPVMKGKRRRGLQSRCIAYERGALPGEKQSSVVVMHASSSSSSSSAAAAAAAGVWCNTGDGWRQRHVQKVECSEGGRPEGDRACRSSVDAVVNHHVVVRAAAAAVM
jgi:hypothetical protein